MNFEKNIELEKLLKKINFLLTEAESREIKKVKNYPIPTILLIGNPRSGSTLLLQWLASQQVFAYPNNFLSRLYGAPYIGSLISEMITNPIYNYGNEFADINLEFDQNSNVGKTRGFISPHEFWYFWRNHFHFSDIPISDKEFSLRADFNTFNKKLSLIQSVYQKPFVCKAHLMNWYLKAAAKNFKNVIYLHHTREPIANIRSLLQARITWKKDKNKWFSFKPREYDQIKDMDMYHQVAGQVYFIEKEIQQNIPILGNRYIHISYEQLCQNPKSFFYKLIKLINKYNKGKQIKTRYIGQSSFVISNPKTEFDNERIKEAYNYFNHKFGKIKNLE